MANYCNEKIHFEGKDGEIKILKKMLEKSKIDNDFSLENFSKNAGLSDVFCRGEIEDYIYYSLAFGCTESCIDIVLKTAWHPAVQMWEAMLKKLQLNSVKFCAKAENCGTDLSCVLYDPDNINYFQDEIYTDFYLTGKNLEKFHPFCEKVNFCSKEKLLKETNLFFNKNFKTAEQAINFIKKINKNFEGDDLIIIHFYERNDDINNYK